MPPVVELRSLLHSFLGSPGPCPGPPVSCALGLSPALSTGTIKTVIKGALRSCPGEPGIPYVKVSMVGGFEDVSLVVV